MSLDKILPRMTGAQKRALSHIPIKRDFIPAHTGFPWRTLSCLKSLGLIRGVKDAMQGMGPTVYHRITPLGLAVRAALNEE